MRWIPYKAQLSLVGLAYAGALGLSTLLVFWRYLQYQRHPDDVAASSGMWAGGDLMLEYMICAMFLGVTFLLVLVIFRSEPAYTLYSKIMLGISLTMPLSIGLFFIPTISQSNSPLGWFSLFRVFASPVVIAALAMSRLFARFPQAKRLTTYGLLIETITFVSCFALLFSRH